MVRQLAKTMASAALAAGLAAAPAAADGLKIGALMPMTGGLQTYGEACLNGVRLAIDEINRAGGVLGAPVTLAVGDTQTKPQAGVDAAHKLVGLEKVQAIVGALASGVTAPVAQSVSRGAGIPQVSSASTSPVLTGLDDGDMLFRTVPSDAFQGIALAQVAMEKGVGDVAVVYNNNDYGQGLADSFGAAFAALGGTVRRSVAFEEGQASFRGELQSAARGGAPALVLIAYPEDGIPILRQALEGGYFSRFVFTDGMKAPAVIETIGAAHLEGTFGTAPEALADSDAAARFRAAYQRLFGAVPPTPFIDTTYDATMLLALAAEKARAAEPAAIHGALRAVANPPGQPVLPGDFARAKELLAAGRDIDYVGAAGSQNLDAAGDVSGTFAHWEIRGGQIVTVKVFEPE